MSESFTTSHTTDGHNFHRTKQPIRCPACGSCSIHTKNHAHKVGGTLGAGVGVMSSLSGVAQGASSGAALAFRFTSSTQPLTRISAAVLGALVGGAIGCATGAALGQVIDDTILNNYQCLRSYHSFQAISRLLESRNVTSR